MTTRMLRPDSKGRISLGVLAEGVSGFTLTQTDDHKIILEPYTEIPMHEKWLYHNKKAQKMISKGLDDAKSGRVSNKGCFAKYTDDDIE